MLDLQKVTFLLETSGETITIGDFRLRAGEIDGLAQIDGKAIASGAVEKILAVGSESAAAIGSFSLFAGREKIGTINWDGSGSDSGVGVDWTPLSKDYRATVLRDRSRDKMDGEVRLKVSKCRREPQHSSNLATSTAGLGLAGF